MLAYPSLGRFTSHPCCEAESTCCGCIFWSTMAACSGWGTYTHAGLLRQDKKRGSTTGFLQLETNTQALTGSRAKPAPAPAHANLPGLAQNSCLLSSGPSWLASSTWLLADALTAIITAGGAVHAFQRDNPPVVCDTCSSTAARKHRPAHQTCQVAYFRGLFQCDDHCLAK